MGDMADYYADQLFEMQFELGEDDEPEQRFLGGQSIFTRQLGQGQSLDVEPSIWVDHKGNEWRLSQMESTHLVNILRLVVNRWAESLGVRPVPIRNPQAILDPNHPNAWLAVTAQRMAEELLRRLQAGEQLPGGYAVVWDKVVNKIQECLRADKQPLNQKLLAGANRLLAA